MDLQIVCLAIQMFMLLFQWRVLIFQKQNVPNNKQQGMEDEASSNHGCNQRWTCSSCRDQTCSSQDSTNCRKQSKQNKKAMSRTKRRRSSITWNEDESSSTTSKSTIAFMVKASASSSEDSDSEVSTSTSKAHTYEELQDAFDKLFKESQKLSIKYSKLKKQMEVQNEECSSFKEVINSLRLENSDLQTKVNDTSRDECTNIKLNSQLPCEKCKTYEEEIFILEIENASLKTDLRNASSNASTTDLLLKEANDRCKAQETKLHTLENNLAKLSKAKSDLDTCLSVQRNMNDRTGLGFKQAFNKKKTKQFQKPFQKHRYQSRTSSITCNYCMKHGHVSYDCNYRKFGVPQGYYTWVKKAPKGMTNFRGPKTVWVPKYD